MFLINACWLLGKFTILPLLEFKLRTRNEKSVLKSQEMVFVCRVKDFKILPRPPIKHDYVLASVPMHTMASVHNSRRWSQNRRHPPHFLLSFRPDSNACAHVRVRGLDFYNREVF